jgi:hypothetical protein
MELVGVEIQCSSKDHERYLATSKGESLSENSGLRWEGLAEGELGSSLTIVPFY